MQHRPLALVGLALVLAACGGSGAGAPAPRLSLVPPGPFFVCDVLGVEVTGDVSRVSMAIDGVPVPGPALWPTGEALAVDVSQIPQGMHVLSVLGEDGRAQVTAELEVAHDALAITSVDPPSGLLTYEQTVASFAATVQVNHPLAAAGVHTYLPAFFPFTPTVTIEPGLRTVEILYDTSIALQGRLDVGVGLTDACGSVLVYGLYWDPRTVSGAVGGRSPANGVVNLTVSPDQIDPRPDTIELWADEVRLATFVGAPPAPFFEWTYDWDTAAWSEGSHALSLRSPGWVTGCCNYVDVDRTPPTVVRWLDLASIFQPVVLRVSEPMVDLDPRVLVNGVERPTTELVDLGLVYLSAADAGIDVPAHVVVDLGPYAQDLAGNPVVRDPIEFDYAPLLGEWDDPLPGVTAGVATVDVRSTDFRGEFEASLLSAPAASGGGIEARRMLSWDVLSSAPAPDRVDPGATVTALSTSDLLTAWTEQGASKSVAVAFRSAAGGPFGAAQPLDPGSDEPFVIGGSAAQGLLVTVPDGAGGRKVDVRWTGGDPIAGFVAEGGPTSAPGSTVHGPRGVWIENGLAMVTWTETPPGGGAARLVVAEVDPAMGSWVELTTAVNADASSSAADAAVWAVAGVDRCVAWTEAGRVWARRWTGAGFGDAAALSTEGTAARSPVILSDVFAHPVVLFLEGPSGAEVIRVARPTDSGWTLAPASIDPGSGGARSLFAGGDVAVGWVDSAGGVRLRVWNR